MDSVCHMDRDGFMRCLEGTKSMGQRRCITMYLQLESMESVGHRKESSERHNKTGKEKPSTEDISSEGHC
jgi:hypothetical protein